MKWMPVDGAPKEEMALLVFGPVWGDWGSPSDDMAHKYWGEPSIAIAPYGLNKDGSAMVNDGAVDGSMSIMRPTHYMPLPDPPGAWATDDRQTEGLAPKGS